MTDLRDLEVPAGTGNAQIGWVSDVAAEMLRRLGLRYVALNPGASYRGLHDSIVNYLGNRDPQMLLCLHEDHAVSIAHGYARATGEPMGCVLHSNVGLMHGLMGIFNAWCNRVPMLVLGANGPVDAPARRPWIDWIHTTKDQGALLRNFTKWDDEPRSAEAMVESLSRAMLMTRTAPSAPVYVCLDAGLQERPVDGVVALPDLARFAPPPLPPAASETVARAADLLLAARQPVIMMGRMSRKPEDWQRRVRLAELLGASVVTDMKTRAVFPTEHKLHIGPAASFLPQTTRDFIARADVVFLLDWVDPGGSLQMAFGRNTPPPAKVINCTLDSYLHNGWSMDLFALPPADIPVLADPDVFIGQLLVSVEGKLAGKPPRWDGKPQRAAPPPARRAGTDASSPITSGDIARALSAVRDTHELALSNTGMGWDADAYPLRHPLDFLGHDGGGGLGSSPGSAIGAALGLRDTGRKVVCVCGDGDFLQGATALWTAAHYHIPVLWIVSNNRSNFNDEVHQQTVARMRGRPAENKWIGQRIDDPPVNMAGLARDQGVAGEGPIEKVGDLAPALARALAALDLGEPYLLDVHITMDGET